MARNSVANAATAPRRCLDHSKRGPFACGWWCCWRISRAPQRIALVPEGFSRLSVYQYLPFAEHACFFVIIGIAWMIRFAVFSHVVAESAEAFFLASGGQTSLAVILSALAGKIVRGVSLVAVLNQAHGVS